MVRSVAAMAVSAALAAFLFIALPPLVNASAPLRMEKSQAAINLNCDTYGWPYARACLRDLTRNAESAASMRLVTTDRIPWPELQAAAEPILASSEETTPRSSEPAAKSEAPASWIMADADLRLHIAAGDFVRRTVP